MPARSLPYRPAVVAVIAVVAVLLTATVAPFVGSTAAKSATAATDGASASFGAAAAPSATFDETVVYEQRGDVANVTVRASEPATVNLGSPEDGFWLQVRVGKGTTKLRLDTYRAGESGQYSLGEMVWATKGSIKSRELKTDPIEAPLDTAEYEMNVTISGQERAVGTLVVEERATHGLSARIAPRATDATELSSEAEMQDATMPPWNESVAHDDWLFLHVDASGVEGALSEARLDGDGDVMRVTFRQTNPPMNGERNEFTGASVERLFTDGDTEGFYLAVDTGEHDIEPGDKYEITFVVPAESPLADERETVSTTIRVVERRVELDRKGPGNYVVVEGKTTLTGTTTLTPGSTINITARDTDLDPFVIPKEVRVADDRTFAVTMDFSGLESGREFDIRLPDQGRTVPGMVEGRTTTTTETPTTTQATTTTETPTTTDQEDTSAPDTTTTTQTTTTTETTVEGLTQVAVNGTERTLTQQAKRDNASDDGSGPVPGFGPVAALTALVAAGVLALRRR
jgi:PGF-CTERM protein